MKEVKEVSEFDKKKKDYYERSMEEIQKGDVIFIEDLVILIGISKPTFYTYIPVGSDEFNDVKIAIEKNKISIKSKLRKRWFSEPHPTTDAMLYKIVANTEERMALSTQFIETKQPAQQELSEQELNEKIEKLQDGK